ncbi:MAG: Asp-tRNA(Asn)/Glu-tRNA(Gln) amidotransferase subunit GatC [Clostridia bacterium]|nr:Asp-tRNA(Asn)/Glu-tRNA(Gln) amidotransferase subunit GatC [Clostridia bacterium]
MQVSSEEILHIANLANLNLKEEEIEKYKKDLQDILNFANIVNNADVKGLTETIGANEACNVFRKDEIVESSKREELLQNAEEQQGGMFKIPKVI